MLEDAHRKVLLARLAWARRVFGPYLDGDVPVILPDGEHFPDAFTPDEAGIVAVAERVRSYTPLAQDVPMAFASKELAETSSGSSCSSGGCGSGGGEDQLSDVVRSGEGYVVRLAAGDLSDPMRMVAALARAIATMVLIESGEALPPGEPESLAEIVAVTMGFGLVLLNASCVYKKGCGGLRAHSSTHLGIDELGFLFAADVAAKGAARGGVRGQLAITQRESFDACDAWFKARPQLIETLRESPAHLEDGLFSTEEESVSWFARLFGKRRELQAPPKTPSAAGPRSTKSAKSARGAPRPVDHKLKQIVEDALAEE
jgi:hypothetical protein